MSGDAIQLLLPDGTQTQMRGNADGTITVSGAGASGSVKAEIVDSSGTPLDYTVPAPIEQQAATAATTTTVASTTTNGTLLSSDATRVAATIYNSDANALLIKYGATASASSFSYRIKASETWDMPYRYVGQIDGLWEGAGAGTAFITSLTRT